MKLKNYNLIYTQLLGQKAGAQIKNLLGLKKKTNLNFFFNDLINMSCIALKMSYWKVRLVPCLLIFSFFCNSKVVSQTITLNSPSVTTYTDVFSVGFAISEPAGSPQSVTLHLACTAGPCLTAPNPNVDLFLKNPVTSLLASVSQTSLLSATNFFTTNSSSNILANGTYSVYIQYKRPASAGGDSVKSGTKVGVVMSNSTYIPALTLPIANSNFSTNIPVSIALGEAYLPGSAKLIFTNNTGVFSDTLTLADGVQSQSFSLNPTYITTSANIISTTNSILPDDTYKVTISFQDTHGHLAATATSLNVKVETHTTPAVIYPMSDSVFTRKQPLVLSYNLPDSALANTAYLTLSSATANFRYAIPQSQGYNIDTIRTDSIPNGKYGYSISYQDFLGNTTATSVIDSFYFGANLIPPIILSPISNAIFTSQIPNIFFKDSIVNVNKMQNKFLQFNQIINGSAGPLVTTIELENSSVDSINLNYHHLSQSASKFRSISGLDSLPDGFYNLSLFYNTIYGDTVAHVNVTNIALKAFPSPPIINQPVNQAIYIGPIPISYFLPEPPIPGSVKLIIKSRDFTNISDTITMSDFSPRSTSYLDLQHISNSAGIPPFVGVSSNNYDSLPPGAYTMFFSYEDNFLNHAISDSVNFSYYPYTIPPTLVSPSNNSVTSGVLHLNDIIPQSNLINSKVLNFYQGSSIVSQLVLNDNQNDSLTLNLKNLMSSSSNYKSIVGITSLPDGNYVMQLKYQNVYGDSAASVSIGLIVNSLTRMPVILNPINNSYQKGYFLFQDSLPDVPQASSKFLTIADSANNLVSTIGLVGGQKDSLWINVQHLDSLPVSSVVSYTGPHSIADGKYTITLSYQNQYGSPVAIASTKIKVDASPLLISISPANKTVYGSFIDTLIFSQPVQNFYPNSIIPMLTSVGPSLRIDTITAIVNGLKYAIHVTPLLSGTIGIYNSNFGTGIDSAGKLSAPILLTTNTYVSTTIPPTLVSPSNNSVTSGVLHLNDIIPQSNLINSKVLNFYQGSSIVSQLVLNDNQNDSLTLNLKNLMSSSSNYKSIVGITSLPDGNYVMQLKYQNVYGDSAASVSIGLIVNSLTRMPVILNPINNSYQKGYFLFQDSLPDVPQASSKFLTIADSANNLVSTIGLVGGQKDSLWINVQHLDSLPVSSVVSYTGPHSIADGKYTITLSYQNQYGSPVAIASTKIKVDASPLLISISPANKTVYGSFIDTLIFSQPVQNFYPNSIIPMLTSVGPSLRIDTITAIVNGLKYAIHVTPLLSGTIGIYNSNFGTGIDSAGKLSAPILLTTNTYVDTVVIPRPTITGNTIFCQGDSVLLTSSAASFYLWSNGAITQSIIVKQGGIYNVKVTFANNTSSTSNNITVVENPIPSIPIINSINPITFCQGGVDTLFSSANSGNQWYLNGNAITGATGSIYSASASGNYTVNATAANSCSSATSSAINITVNPTPNIPNLTTSSNITSFCQGDNINIISSANIGNQWYLNNVPLTNATGNIYQTYNAGIYTDTITNIYGCSVGSSKLTLTINPLPSKPSISWNGSQFSTTATGVNYQWLLANNPVSGANNSTYKPIVIGNYRVQVIDPNGCKNVSDSFTLVVTAVNTPPTTPNNHIAKLFPNPATSEFIVQFSQIPLTTITIKLVNANGQIVKEINTNKQSTTIPLSNISTGNYFLKIIGKDYDQTQQLIIKNR